MTAPRSSLLTQRETAEYLGIKAQTLAVWRCTERYPLAYIRVGRLIRYRSCDVEKFLAERTVGGDGDHK